MIFVSSFEQFIKLFLLYQHEYNKNVDQIKAKIYIRQTTW